MKGKLPVENVLVVPAGLRKSFNSCSVFNSSFKYFVTWIKAILGIRLDYPANNNSGRLGKWHILCGSFFFLVNCAADVTSFANGFNIFLRQNKSSTQLEKFSDVKLFTLMMDLINVNLYMLLVHLTFLVVFLIRWKNVYNCLIKIDSQQMIHFTNHKVFYQQIRGIIFIGFLMIVIVKYSFTIFFNIPLFIRKPF